MPDFKQFRLPDVGEGLTEGEILKWYVQPGDLVTTNQMIVEVETAKAAVELPSPYAGRVAELHYPEGATVDVGMPIITVDIDPDGAAPVGDAPTDAPGSPATDVRRPPAAEPPGAIPVVSEHLTPQIPVPDPDVPVEPGMIGGPAPGGRTSVLVGYGPRSVVAKRRPRKQQAGSGPADTGTKPVAPPISVGAAPRAIDPPNAGSAATGQGSGTGDPAPRTVPVPVRGIGSPVGAGGGLRTASGAPAGTNGDWAAPTGGGPSEESSTAPADVSVLAKPPVRKLAKDLGVDLRTIAGTGPDGVITRADVEVAAQSEAEPAEPAGGAATTGVRAVGLVPPPVWDESREQRIPIKGVRKHTAAAMVASAFTAPHVTVFVTIDVTPMMELRRRVAGLPEFAGIKVTPLLFVAKALLLAVRRHPMVNSSWDEQAQEIVVKDYVHLGIAAATQRGLIVPNIKDAGRLPLPDLGVALAELTETARAGRTTPADMAGGTITITNVGVFGVDTGTPILNPGEAAILAFGAVREMPWVVDGQLAVRQVTQLALSFDHRIIDGQLGSEVLADIARVLSDPATALVWS